jgi:hypothetical protein
LFHRDDLDALSALGRMATAATTADSDSASHNRYEQHTAMSISSAAINAVVCMNITASTCLIAQIESQALLYTFSAHPCAILN